jgi:hypothetical protein
MNKLLFLFIFSSPVLYGQALESSIQTSKTSKHANIPFTKLFIIPPPGFSVSQTFSGLKRNDVSHFLVEESLGVNFYNRAVSLSRAHFEQNGGIVFNHQDITINGYSARYLVKPNGSNSKVFLLVFGDSTFTTTVMVTNPVPDEQTEKQIVASLNSIYYNKNENIDPFVYAPFVIDDQKSKLKFFQIQFRSYVYTIGGLENAMSTRSPRAMVIPFPREKNMTIEQIASLLIGKDAIFDFVQNQKPDVLSGKTAGQDTCEAVVYGKLLGKEALTYHYIVLKDNQVVSFQGLAKMDFEESIKQFKLLAHTIRIK